MRELEATVGEKRQLGHELTTMALKFEAAQSMWERHVENGGSFSDIMTEDILDKVVDALTERDRGRLLAADSTATTNSDDSNCSVVDGDALAAKFRIHPEERHLLDNEV